jgi:hypothetical protein
MVCSVEADNLLRPVEVLGVILLASMIRETMRISGCARFGGGRTRTVARRRAWRFTEKGEKGEGRWWRREREEG